MKHLTIITGLFCMLHTHSFWAQVPLTPKLSKKINEISSSEKIPVRIEFFDNVDCFALKNEMIAAKIPVSKRPQKVINALQQQAIHSQAPILSFLQHAGVEHIQSFWIVNVIVCDIDKSTLMALNQFATIALLDYENNTFIPHDPIKATSISTEKAVGAAEPGLIDINARPMWNLGYTGRGHLVFNYDTGVWPIHPVFANRFLAHYKPLSQSWHGYFSPTPSGETNDHGTHTLGTIAGLDTLTKDTVGVAFGAYWIANDLITETTQTMPPLTALIESFQWALNPDGDTSTTDDIPDVISNSWRWYDGDDTLQCGGYIVNLMNAVEAAGIANVFAGGNFGPSNTTVTAPQRINTSDVNTFSVGAVDGNVAFPYPIASFSSRGPKQCPAPPGPLQIHPEVSAPGVNVRSSFGTDTYAVLSGTSMATPHVSGAILLLKEAFPYLSGEDLMRALYMTAVDLGTAGEDNVYGRGIIDVYAAFQYLSLTNIPVDPLAANFDLAVGIDPNLDGNISCDTNYLMQLSIENKGTQTISNVMLYYSLNGAPEDSMLWTGNLTPGQLNWISLPILTSNQKGDNSFTVRGRIIGQPTEYDLYNNQRIARFNIRPEYTVPYIENFENGFDAGNWVTNNPDQKRTWLPERVVGIDSGVSAAAIMLYSYTPADGERDQLYSPKINLLAAQSATLKFDWAYFRRSFSLLKQDTLTIYIETNCQSINVGTVYTGFGQNLETSDSLVLDFNPKKPADWKTQTVDLSAYAGQQISVVFESTNHNGNNLFIDNVKVYSGTNEPLSIAKSELINSFKLYPNPTKGLFTIELNEKMANEHPNVFIYNTTGELMLSKSIQHTSTELNISTFANGLYRIQFISSEGVIQKNILKQ